MVAQDESEVGVRGDRVADQAVRFGEQQGFGVVELGEHPPSTVGTDRRFAGVVGDAGAGVGFFVVAGHRQDIPGLFEVLGFQPGVDLFLEARTDTGTPGEIFDADFQRDVDAHGFSGVSGAAGKGCARRGSPHFGQSATRVVTLSTVTPTSRR